MRTNERTARPVAAGRHLCQSTLCVLLLACAARALPAEGPATAAVPAARARIRLRGQTQADGAFSFWTGGVLGDWFVAPADGRAELTVTARGKVIGEAGPVIAVELTGGDGEVRQVGRIEVTSSASRRYGLGLPVRTGCFALRLRHTNRVADEKGKQLRHLLVNEIRVAGARRSEYSLTQHALFGGASASRAGARGGRRRVVETDALRVEIDPRTAVWSAADKGSGCRVSGVRPVLGIRGLDVDFAACEGAISVEDVGGHKLGSFTRARLTYRGKGALAVTYTLLIGRRRGEIVARLDFVNRTGRELVVHRAAPVVATEVALGDTVAGWTIIGDGKRYADPYETVGAADLDEFASWWYAAVKNARTRRSVLLGNLTNHKGLGRFLLIPGTRTSLKAAAWSDYEGIVMPAGAEIVGEMTLLHFGRRGTDGLDRLGELIAKAHDIDLAKQHPIDPHVPERLSLFTTWNSYGSGVVRGFPYKFDRAKGDRPFMDPKWTRANRQKLRELGLDKYGYVSPTRLKVRGGGTPLVRRYGNPDFWFKEAQRIAAEHPEYYINGRIDFSNPAVQAFERKRAERGFADRSSIIRYGWDFSDQWRRLPGQHDPFMTSAETYRLATGIWRDLGRRHPRGAYALVWMNIIGISYDRIDVIHIGQDSDQSYYGRGCSFTQGLTRQISGRSFYNGQVWWNSPDSFHVYCGGIYSYEQAKVHASFCSIAGNLVHLGEPLADQDTPEDRLDIIRKVTPTTADVSRAVDVFEHNPARLWNMPVKRPFGQWNVVGLFNFDYKRHGKAITREIRFEQLGLDADAEHVVYEFWSRRLLGVKKGGFTRTLAAPDCEIYSIVPKRDHPVLISTSRHVRQMAYDVLDVSWDASARALRGRSRVVGGRPYQLRIYMPRGFTPAGVDAGDVPAETGTAGRLLHVDFRPPTDADLRWTVRFAK